MKCDVAPLSLLAMMYFFLGRDVVLAFFVVVVDKHKLGALL